MDMPASSDYERTAYWCMMTNDGLPNLVTDTFIATANRLGYVGLVEQGQFGSSDHVNFSNAGMPAAMGMYFGRPEGYTGMITPQHYTVEAFYHTPLDTIEDNVSSERLELCIEVATAAVYDMALNYKASAAQYESIVSPFSVVDDPFANILLDGYDEFGAASKTKSLYK
jgi:aminopeptidase YwaD